MRVVAKELTDEMTVVMPAELVVVTTVLLPPVVELPDEPEPEVELVPAGPALPLVAGAVVVKVEPAESVVVMIIPTGTTPAPDTDETSAVTVAVPEASVAVAVTVAEAPDAPEAAARATG